MACYFCHNLRGAANVLLFVCLILSGSVLWKQHAAASSDPRQMYLSADACLKQLQNSPDRRQKVSEWLICIERYEDIYKAHPENTWAPAGMYKAAELYQQLFDLSGNGVYKTRAQDLLTRIRNKYPSSAYAARAATRMTSPGTPLPASSTPPSPGKHILSQKEKTRKPPSSPDAETEMSLVTDLRFWSNPEYTRIAVSATRDREFSHRLLKKDPTINVPFQRLYVDIQKARLDRGVPEHTPIHDDLLQQARAGQYQPDTVRVVVDIKSFESYKIFSLKDPFRIVIDVWGKSTGDAPSPEASASLPPPDPESRKLEQLTTDHLQSSDIARQLALGVKTIVIDPGHGGSDPGAPGFCKGVWEKDIVLSLARRLAPMIEKEIGATVILTRSSDVRLALEERTAIANTRRADLFISLHCNAAENKNAYGIETYLLNLATDAHAISVAARENATSQKNISDLEYILSDLMKHTKVEESSRLAQNVHQALIQDMSAKYTQIKDLGVKQAPFYVLLGARMPSILIEASFISNERECKRLLSPEYQDDLCRAITRGIKKYSDATNPHKL